MNKLLGEVEVKILDETYKLKPTFQGIAEMEGRSGLSITGLINKALTGQLGLTDVVAVVYGGIVGSTNGNPPISHGALGDHIMVHGMTKLLAPCGQFLGAAYSGKPIGEIDASSVGKSSAKKKKEELGQKK